MKEFFLFEMRQFATNKKNRGVFVLIILASFYYAFILGPSFEPVEQINRKEMVARVDNREIAIHNHVYGPDNFSGVDDVTDLYKEFNHYDKVRIKAVDEQDWPTYAEQSIAWFTLLRTAINNTPPYTFQLNPKYYTYGNIYANSDAWYRTVEVEGQYQGYLDKHIPLTKNILEEKTVFQHIKRLFDTYLPYLLLGVLIFFSIDMVTKDRKHATLVKGFPITAAKKLICKYVVVCFYFFLAIVLATVILLLGLGPRYGVGSLQFPVYLASIDKNITMTQYLGENLLFIFLQGSILFWGIAFLSVSVKNEFVNLFAGCAYLFTDQLYQGRGKGFFMNFSHYPTTYIQTGRVLSTYDNYYYQTELHTFANGSVTLVVTLFLLIGLTVLLTKHRKFVTI